MLHTSLERQNDISIKITETLRRYLSQQNVEIPTVSLFVESKQTAFNIQAEDAFPAKYTFCCISRLSSVVQVQSIGAKQSLLSFPRALA